MGELLPLVAWRADIVNRPALVSANVVDEPWATPLWVTGPTVTDTVSNGGGAVVALVNRTQPPTLIVTAAGDRAIEFSDPVTRTAAHDAALAGPAMHSNGTAAAGKTSKSARTARTPTWCPKSRRPASGRSRQREPVRR